MTILSPSNFNYIISLSLASRLVVLLIQYVSSILIKDHEADAYRNRYHNAILNNSTQYDLSNSYSISYNLIQGFTKWDSQYLLEISLDGYVSEQHLAFLPLYPMTISAVRQLLFEHRGLNLKSLMPITNIDKFNQDLSTINIEDYIKTAIVGFILNNFIFFPVASISLYILTKLVKRKDDKYAKNVVWWFCFNPASIFFSACYTESLFAALTFTALSLIEYKLDNFMSNLKTTNQDQKEFMPLTQLNRLLHVYLTCLAFLALSSATRSNGLMTIGYLGYHFLLKYAPLTQSNRSRWSFMIYISAALEILQDILVLIMSAVLAASGYITFQIYSYIKFCMKERSMQKGTLYVRPDWCDNLIPHPYRHVQKKYWSIEAFHYYELLQLPNFLLAFPITYLVLVGSLKTSRKPGCRIDGRQLVYYLHGILLTIFCGVFVHVQVTTRLVAASCPVVYWIIADSAEKSRWRNKLLILYCTTYFILGSILHCNYYPWT